MNCPLCNETLYVTGSQHSYCPTMLQVTMPWETLTTSHYIRYPYIQVHSMPYQIMEISDQFNIYKHVNFLWKYLMTVPKFPIHSAAQLAHKLQTIITFS